jgi:hypothetical protein
LWKIRTFFVKVASPRDGRTAHEQVIELERWLSETKTRERRHKLAAETIREYLNNLAGERPDLHQLAGIIRQALA